MKMARKTLVKNVFLCTFAKGAELIRMNNVQL